MGFVNDGNRKWWTLGTVCFALLMIVLDGNVVNLAIPSIMKHFNAGLPQMEWVNNAYLLTFAIFLITFGRLGDELGRKRFFVGGLFAFIIGSILCGVAGSVDQLIIFRVIQGIGGAAMMPATLSLIAANFEKKERGTAMGLWGAVSGLGIVLGPVLGGYLTDKGLGGSLNSFFHVTQYWRYVFYINIPIGIAAIIAAMTVIRESKDSEKTHTIDFFGIILSSLAIFSLTYAFIEGAKYGWWKRAADFKLFGANIHFGSISIIPVLFLITIILTVIFILVEKHCQKDPLVDLKLFKPRNFSVGTFTAAVLSFAMMGSFFLLPLFLQVVMGFAPIKTGEILLPFALTIMLIAPLSGRMADKIGGKYLIVAGMAIMALGGYYIGHFRVDTQISDLILPFIVMGVGMGLAMPPLNNITLLETPEDEIGGASGVLSTARQIGSVMGIAILGAFLQTTLAAQVRLDFNKINTLPPLTKTAILASVNNQQSLSDPTAFQADLTTILSKTMPAPKSYLPAEQVAKMTAAQKTAYDQQLTQVQLFYAKQMQLITTPIEQAVKKGFVDSINKTFRLAALIALFGALVSFLFRGQMVSEPAKQTVVADIDPINKPLK